MNGAYWYIGAIALTGACAGFFTGASSSPVVAALLPLLFGLLAGGGGLHLIGTASSFRASQRAWTIAGQCIIAFSLSLLGATFLGIWFKVEFLNSQRAADLRLGNMSVERQANILLLRDRLRVIGASEGEIAAAITQVEVESKNSRVTKEGLASLLKKASVLLDAAQKRLDDRAKEAKVVASDTNAAKTLLDMQLLILVSQDSVEGGAPLSIEEVRDSIFKAIRFLKQQEGGVPADRLDVISTLLAINDSIANATVPISGLPPYLVNSIESARHSRAPKQESSATREDDVTPAIAKDFFGNEIIRNQDPLASDTTLKGS